jgi:hypothetical protein
MKTILLFEIYTVTFYDEQFYKIHHRTQVPFHLYQYRQARERICWESSLTNWVTISFQCDFELQNQVQPNNFHWNKPIVQQTWNNNQWLLVLNKFDSKRKKKQKWKLMTCLYMFKWIYFYATPVYLNEKNTT